MFAMKYMNKAMCQKNEAVPNVLKEIELLAMLEHPFLVNLFYTFQVLPKFNFMLPPTMFLDIHSLYTSLLLLNMLPYYDPKVLPKF